MRDDIETNTNFITLVENNPCLYDHTRPYYSNRNKQDKVWAEIAEQFNESVTTCKERWKNIRGRYVKQFKTSPSGSGAKSRKPYYLAEYLSFLDTFIKSRPPSGNLQSPPSASDNAHDLSDVDEESLTESFRRPIQSSINTDTSGPSTPEPGISLSAEPAYRRQRNKKGISLNDLNSSVINYYETKKKRLCEKAENSAPRRFVDPDLAFLQSILPDMKQMNESQKRNFKVGVLHLTGQILNQPVITPSLPRPSATTSSTLTAFNNNDNEQTGRPWNESLLPQYTPISQCTDSAVIPNSFDLYPL